jgi:hypothetical protein
MRFTVVCSKDKVPVLFVCTHILSIDGDLTSRKLFGRDWRYNYCYWRNFSFIGFLHFLWKKRREILENYFILCLTPLPSYVDRILASNRYDPSRPDIHFHDNSLLLPEYQIIFLNNGLLVEGKQVLRESRGREDGARSTNKVKEKRIEESIW